MCRPTLPSDDIEKSKAWIQNCFDNENGWNFAIELLPTADNPPRTGLEPRVIGMVGMVREQEVGYMFNAEYWGKGHATEALKAFMPAFFDHYSGGSERKFEYAEAHTDPELVASQNVLQKAGFMLYEKREKDFENPVLGWRDTLVYRLYRSGSAPQDATNGTA